MKTVLGTLKSYFGYDSMYMYAIADDLSCYIVEDCVDPTYRLNGINAWTTGVKLYVG